MPVDQYLFLSLGEGYLKGKAFQLLLLLLLLLLVCSLKGNANALMSDSSILLYTPFTLFSLG